MLYIKVSNTGKTITLTLSDDLVNNIDGRVDWSYNPESRMIALKKNNDFGLKISDNVISRHPRRYPNWPLHGLIELDIVREVSDSGEIVWFAQLPEVLPSPTPKNVPSHNAPSEQLLLPIISANIILQINSKTYIFNLPADVIIDNVLEWTKQGYAI